MAGYAPLPDETDPQHCEEMRQRWVCGTALTGYWGGFGGGFATDSQAHQRGTLQAVTSLAVAP